mgnify:CR=1 FL=1
MRRKREGKGRGGKGLRNVRVRDEMEEDDGMVGSRLWFTVGTKKEVKRKELEGNNNVIVSVL